MATLTAADVAGVVKAMGTPSGTTVAEWVEKARQESRFRTDVEDFLGSGHWGLWQIADSHLPIGGVTTVEGLKDPYGNFAAAKALYAESGWRPWAASGGKPRPSASSRAAAAAPTSPTDLPGASSIPLGEQVLDALPDPIAGVASAIADIGRMIGDAAEWLTDVHNIARVVQVAGGLALGLVALSIVAKPVVSDVTRTVKPF